MASLEIRDNQPLMNNTVTLPVADGGNNGSPDPNDDVDDFGDLLAKPGIIYDAWEDEDKEIDFHTDV